MPSGRVFSGKKTDVTILNSSIAITGTVDGTLGTQYPQGSTSDGNTKEGVLFLGVNSTTAQAIKVASDGTIFVSGGGGGTQYQQNTTDGANTKTGTLVIGVSGTTNYALGISSTGAISYIDTINFIAAGTVDAVVTGTVTALPSGTQTVAFSATQPISGSISVINAPTVTVSTGTVSIAGTIGTVSTVSTVLGTLAISGSLSVINTPTVTIGGTANAILLGGTARAGSIFSTAHPTTWDACVIATTSAAAGVIIKTSGGHTLYITDLMVNVAGPMSVTLCSETTAKMYLVGLATNGGAVLSLQNPMVLTTAHSFRVIPGSSGSCSVFAVGYTVT